MQHLLNIAYVIGVVVIAIYIAPFLIALMASGLIQLILTIAFVWIIFKMAFNGNSDKFDRY